MNLHWWRPSKWSILDDFHASNACFLGLKLDFQVLKLFFKKSVKKYLQRQQYDFSKNDEKTWKFSKFWFFWNVLDHFTKIRKEKDFLKMKNKVLDELCGRQQCKFKIIDHQMIILPLKMLITEMIKFEQKSTKKQRFVRNYDFSHLYNTFHVFYFRGVWKNTPQNVLQPRHWWDKIALKVQLSVS